MAKMTDTEKLNLLIRDDPEISGKMYARMKMHINEATVVDAVEVVRCKECKWRCNGKDCDHPLLLSWSWGAIRNVKDNDFCSYGERKDNEQT